MLLIIVLTMRITSFICLFALFSCSSFLLGVDAEESHRNAAEVQAEYLRQTRKSLVDSLHTAAFLEHTLLNAYLTAAASLKSLPEEFEEMPSVIDGKLVTNSRSAVQFELARQWKLQISNVAKEEMLHLHYVSCLLRGLGEPAEFRLPKDSLQGSGWIFNDWNPVLQGQAANQTVVPVAVFSPEVAASFVLYESTDSFQTLDPFNTSNEARHQLEKLREWELKYHVGQIVRDVPENLRNDTFNRLFFYYNGLMPLKNNSMMESLEFHVQDFKNHRKSSYSQPTKKFRSIADFYSNVIEPLYSEAFQYGWVVNKNKDLNQELSNSSSNVVDAGFDDELIIYHPTDYKKHAKNYGKPLGSKKRLRDIINEIIGEGEGYQDFMKHLDELLKVDPTTYTATNRAYENLRLAHLYKFSYVFTSLQHEIDLCAQAGLNFSATRVPVDTSKSMVLQNLGVEIPYYFNAVNLVVNAWLRRVYEIATWKTDAARRTGIEMIVAWPLMSIGIRPFLELAGIFGQSVVEKLFHLDGHYLVETPTYATRLLFLFNEVARSQEINDEMDFLAVRVLYDVATWAEKSLKLVKDEWRQNKESMTNVQYQIITRRLKNLSVLKDVKGQFEFRVQGGYSADPGKQISRKNADDYSELPDSMKPVFSNSFVLRIRFAGHTQIQMATDPDPPAEEVGTSGYNRLYPSDHILFDRSVVLQNGTKPLLQRGPSKEKGNQIPNIGINVIDMTLQVTNATTVVSSEGLVNGLTDVFSIEPSIITGSANDPTGEPLDPFNIKVHVPHTTGTSDDPDLIRSVYGGKSKKSFMEMSPVQRSLTNRGPMGIDTVASDLPPQWVESGLSTFYQDLLRKYRTDTEALSGNYTHDRAELLTNMLLQTLQSVTNKDEPSKVELQTVMNYAERYWNLMYAAPLKRNGWITYVGIYCHTVSSFLTNTTNYENNRILQAFSSMTGLPFTVTNIENRTYPNSRWLANYGFGIMDTDTSSAMMYGELYIPLTVLSSANNNKRELVHNMPFTWTFTAGMKDVLLRYLSSFETCSWLNPKCTAKTVDGLKTRSYTFNKGSVVNDVLIKHSSEGDKIGYTYHTTGLNGVEDYQGEVSISTLADESIEFTWRVHFHLHDALQDAVTIWRDHLKIRDEITSRINAYVAARSVTFAKRPKISFAPHGTLHEEF